MYCHQSGLLREFESAVEDLVFPTQEEFEADVNNAIRSFNDIVKQEGKWACCAACGEMFTAKDTDLMDLGSYQLSYLERSAVYASMWRELPSRYQAAHHSVEIDGKVYALAPDLVDLDTRTGYFCEECQHEECPKDHTRFLDFDYGVSYTDNRVFQASLPRHIKNKKLTEFNSMALARSIQYCVHVKLSVTGEQGSVKVLSQDMFYALYSPAIHVSILYDMEPFLNVLT